MDDLHVSNVCVVEYINLTLFPSLQMFHCFAANGKRSDRLFLFSSLSFLLFGWTVLDCILLPAHDDRP